MNILMIKSKYPEPKNFSLYRENIGEMYIFIHFLTPANAFLKRKETKINPGGCVFFEPNTSQRISAPDCNLIHDWFHADNSCGELMKKFGLECETVYYPSDSENIANIISKIEYEHIHKNKFCDEAINSFAENLFVELARAETQKSSVAYIDNYQRKVFVKARAKIHADLQEQWTVKKMAELVNLSESRFFYLYKKLFGISPQQDLMKRRIHTAQALLIQDNISVEKCAELTGYTNQYHFIRQFKQITGTTPGKLKLLKQS